MKKRIIAVMIASLVGIFGCGCGNSGSSDRSTSPIVEATAAESEVTSFEQGHAGLLGESQEDIEWGFEYANQDVVSQGNFLTLTIDNDNSIVHQIFVFDDNDKCYASVVDYYHPATSENEYKNILVANFGSPDENDIYKGHRANYKIVHKESREYYVITAKKGIDISDDEDISKAIEML